MNADMHPYTRDDYSITHVGKFEPEGYRDYPKIDTTLESMAPAVDDMECVFPLSFPPRKLTTSRRLCAALGFAEGYDVVNPSRVDPHKFLFGRHPDNYQDTKDTLMSQRQTTRPIFCVTTGILRREFLSLDGELPYTNAKKARRGVAIAPFESEINRAFAFFNLAAKMPSDQSFGFPCAEHGTIIITTKPSSTGQRSPLELDPLYLTNAFSCEVRLRSERHPQAVRHDEQEVRRPRVHRRKYVHNGLIFQRPLTVSCSSHSGRTGLLRLAAVSHVC